MDKEKLTEATMLALQGKLEGKNLIDILKNKDKKKLLVELLDSEKKEQIVDLVLNDLNDETFKKLIERNNLKKIRFHDLRHSCASLLLANGVNMKEIQLYLGHSNFNTTANIYSHVDSSSKERSANIIANVLKL